MHEILAPFQKRAFKTSQTQYWNSAHSCSLLVIMWTALRLRTQNRIGKSEKQTLQAHGTGYWIQSVRFVRSVNQPVNLPTFISVISTRDHQLLLGRLDERKAHYNTWHTAVAARRDVKWISSNFSAPAFDVLTLLSFTLISFLWCSVCLFGWHFCIRMGGLGFRHVSISILHSRRNEH